MDTVPQEVLSASGQLSGDIEASVDSELSGTSGLPSVSGSGDTEITVTILPFKPEKGQYLK